MFIIKIHIHCIKLYETVTLLNCMGLLETVWSKIGPKLGPKWSEMTCKSYFSIFSSKNSYSASQIVWKNGLIWLSRPSRKFLAFLDLNCPKLCPKCPGMTLRARFQYLLVRFMLSGSYCVKKWPYLAL